MRFEGTVVHDSGFWLAEIPSLGALTQGCTRTEALAMIGDWLETMVNRQGFRARVRPTSNGKFEVSGTDTAAMTALLLKRQS